MLICDNIYPMESEKDKPQNPEDTNTQAEGPVQIGETIKEVVDDLLQQALQIREARQTELDEQLNLIEWIQDLKREAAGMQGSLLRLQNVRISAKERELDALNTRLSSPIVIPPDIYNQ